MSVSAILVWGAGGRRVAAKDRHLDERREQLCTRGVGRRLEQGLLLAWRQRGHHGDRRNESRIGYRSDRLPIDRHSVTLKVRLQYAHEPRPIEGRRQRGFRVNREVAAEFLPFGTDGTIELPSRGLFVDGESQDAREGYEVAAVLRLAEGND